MNRSTLHNTQPWCGLGRTGNCQLQHQSRSGRKSNLENENAKSIPKEYIDKIFAAIDNYDKSALIQIYQTFETQKYSRSKIRKWLINDVFKDKQGCLIYACCKGNLTIIQFIIEYLFLGLKSTAKNSFITTDTLLETKPKNEEPTTDKIIYKLYKKGKNNIDNLPDYQVIDHSDDLNNFEKSNQTSSNLLTQRLTKNCSSDTLDNIDNLTTDFETCITFNVADAEEILSNRTSSIGSFTAEGIGLKEYNDSWTPTYYEDDEFLDPLVSSLPISRKNSVEDFPDLSRKLYDGDVNNQGKNGLYTRAKFEQESSQMKNLSKCRSSMFSVNNIAALRKRTCQYIPELKTFLEIKGTIECGDDNIDGSTALWAASSFGYDQVCKYLISKGADIHTRTNAGSTPLRCACYDGHLETVQLLTDAGADIEASNKHGHTCLMIACYRGQTTVVEYLLEKGANVNQKGNRGSTALHDAAEKDQLIIFKLLINKGADLNIKDNHGQSALINAAIHGSTKIIDYASIENDANNQSSSSNLNVDRLHLINAKELLGCWYIDRDNNEFEGLKLWKQAVLLRLKYNLPKENKGINAIKDTISAIESMCNLFNWDMAIDCPIDVVFPMTNEFSSITDLLVILQDLSLVKLQSHLVRFRILGPDHHECSTYMRTRGAQYADQGDWYKCAKIWLVTMLLYSKYRDPICGATIQHFICSIQLFQHMLASSMVTPGVNTLDFRDIICTIEGAFYECQRWYDTKIYCTDDIETPEDRANKMLRYSLILTNFALLCLEDNVKNIVKNTSDKSLLNRLIHVIKGQKNLRSPHGPALIHMASSESMKFGKTNHLDGIQLDDTDMEEEWFSLNSLDATTSNLFKKWLRLPSVDLVKFLIKCGHDQNSLDNELNTPLHIACKQRASSTLISVLAKSGINAFQQNKWGKTPFRYLKQSLLLKEVNTRHFFDDGPNQINSDTGESYPRNTSSAVLNRYSASRSQIANTGTLNYLLKNRSLKSIAAGMVGEMMKLPFIKCNKMQFVDSLNSYLAPKLYDYLTDHCYEVKQISNQIKYCESRFYRSTPRFGLTKPKFKTPTRKPNDPEILNQISVFDEHYDGTHFENLLEFDERMLFPENVNLPDSMDNSTDGF